MSRFKWILILSIPVVAVCVYVGFRPVHTVARLSLDDGSEYLVTQHLNDMPGFYAVDFWYRTNGGRWGWCYIDHEDTPWFRGQLKHNQKSNSVQVFRGDELRAELFADAKTFALYAEYQRELPAPQDSCDPPKKRN